MELNRKNKHLNSMINFLICIRYGPITGLSSDRHRFVLVHGAGHGAWCWYKIIPTLESDGHNVTAIDLAASGIDLRSARSLRSISEYFQPLIEFMGCLDEDERVILVGHGLGGLAVSQAMEMFPSKVYVAVFVAALMPGPTLNISTIYRELTRWQTPWLDSRFIYGDGPNNPPTLFVMGPQYLSSIMYKFSPEEDIELVEMLVRPNRLFKDDDMERALMVTKEKYGWVKRVFIVVEDDMMLQREFQRWMIKRNPPDQTEGIRGSDHMVMISKPKHLFIHLQLIANHYALIA